MTAVSIEERLLFAAGASKQRHVSYFSTNIQQLAAPEVHGTCGSGCILIVFHTIDDLHGSRCNLSQFR